ncbi:MAG: UDP-2,3-diacylglucosamine diphosphatase [Bacteroidales bacterium]|nr:UDP-2,3-diacylglucosamine diphosphatase [Bacteroidales bacterium]
MTDKKNIYFASDAHLGLPNYQKSLFREKLLVKWLDEIKNDAKEIYLLGDMFDFWYEYKQVVPRGFTRFLGKIAEIVDSGIPVHLFTGNHDIWIFDYLPTETGVILHRKPIVKTLNGKKFYLAHGDGLGPYDKGYKLLKKIFTNPVLQWLFSRLHPNFAIGLGHLWSNNSRFAKGLKAEKYKGDDKEWLYLYAKSLLKKEHFDYFVFGHRHILVERQIGSKSRFINLGDWITNFSYGVFDGENFELKKYTKNSMS